MMAKVIFLDLLASAVGSEITRDGSHG